MEYFERFQMDPKYNERTPSDASSTQKELMKMLVKEIDKQDYQLLKINTNILEPKSISKPKTSKSVRKFKNMCASPERSTIDNEFEK